MSDTLKPMSEQEAIEAMIAGMEGTETPSEDAEVEGDADVDLETEVEADTDVEEDSATGEAPDYAAEAEHADASAPEEGAVEQEEVNPTNQEVEGTEGALQAERENMQAQAEQVQRLRDELIARLQELKGPDLDDYLPDPDLLDENSDKYDPEAFNRQQARYQKLQRDQRKADAELDKLQKQQLEANRKEYDAFVADQRRYYETHLPQIVDPETGRAVAEQVVNYATSLPSLTAEQLGSAPADLVHVLWKAMEYDKMQAASAKPLKPTAKKTTQVRSSGHQIKPKTKAQQLAQDFAKKPRTEAEAMALFKAQLK